MNEFRSKNSFADHPNKLTTILINIKMFFKIQSSFITHSVYVLCSLIVLSLLDTTGKVQGRLVWIPRLDNEKDNINDFPIIEQVLQDITQFFKISICI